MVSKRQSIGGGPKRIVQCKGRDGKGCPVLIYFRRNPETGQSLVYEAETDKPHIEARCGYDKAQARLDGDSGTKS